MVDNKVRDIRLSRGVTQEGLARKAKLSRSMVSLIENAKAVPSVYAGKNLAKALGTSVDRVFPGSGPKKVGPKGGANKMAKNTGQDSRVGAVRDRSQFRGPNGNYTKRDTETGRIMAQKTTGGKFKGVRKEK